ncbi:MAG: hypothetical protein AAFQ51_16750, partial [Pseudomonadota bacterium]
MPQIPAGTLNLARTVNALSTTARVDRDALTTTAGTATVSPNIGDILAPQGPTPLLRVPVIRPDDLLAAQLVF